MKMISYYKKEAQRNATETKDKDTVINKLCSRGQIKQSKKELTDYANVYQFYIFKFKTMLTN